MKKSEKELKKYEYKICATVNDIDEKVRERFKALAHVSDQLAELSKKYEEEARQIEYEADQVDQPLFKLRALIVEGKDFESTEITTDEFDKRYEELKDETYDKIKIKDYKHVENLADKKGIPGFWMTAMKNNKILGSQITKNDEKLLRYLVNIEHIAVENSNDFILKFYFVPNEYIQNTVITKRYLMHDSSASEEDHGNIKKVECTPLKWRNGMNLLDKPKPAKGKKGKKKKKQEENEVSFFQFFTAKEQLKGNPDEDDLDADDELKLDQLEEDYDDALEIRDEVIPLALEYYLNIVEEEYLEEAEGEEGEGDEGADPIDVEGQEIEDGEEVDNDDNDDGANKDDNNNDNESDGSRDD